MRLLAILLLATGLQAQDFFPISVWYGGGKARAPMLERDARAKKEIWRKDVRQIKALGFNTIRCWIDWATGEPAEGKYNFETLDVLLELAEEEGLQGHPPGLHGLGAAMGRREIPRLPLRLLRRFGHPAGVVARLLHRPSRACGVPIRPSTPLWPGRARKSKAFIGWDLWSEPHVINWATPTYIRNPEFCFCPNTLAKFRAWLKQKYGTLDKLNQAWYRRYTSWDQVEPGRLSTILSYTDYIDWKTFIADKLGGDLRSRYRSRQEVAPDTIVTSHAAGVGLFSSPHWWEGQSDDWTMAQQVDFYGTSFYPKHSAFVDRDVEWRGALLDFTRSFGYDGGRRGFWIGELQGGFGTIALNVSPTVTPDDLRIWTWSALSRGAKGINYYAWYPDEHRLRVRGASG